MTDVSEARVKRYIISCPRCSKKHSLQGMVIDEVISCSCGFDYYAFAADDLQIVLPSSEAAYKSIARAMRRFVVANGRCQDIPPELYEDGFDCQVLDNEFDKALTDHQIGQ